MFTVSNPRGRLFQQPANAIALVHDLGFPNAKVTDSGESVLTEARKLGLIENTAIVRPSFTVLSYSDAQIIVKHVTEKHCYAFYVNDPSSPRHVRLDSIQFGPDEYTAKEYQQEAELFADSEARKRKRD